MCHLIVVSPKPQHKVHHFKLITMTLLSSKFLSPKGGASGIRNLSATGFELNIHQVVGSYRTRPEEAKKHGWELLWTATGFGC